MPVYHFTLHAYRSWSPAHGPPRIVAGTPASNLVIRSPTHDGRCSTMVLQSIPKSSSHPNFRKSWCSDVPISANAGVGASTLSQLIRLTSTALSLARFPGVASRHGETQEPPEPLPWKATRESGRRWFVNRGSRKRVINPDHLDYLVKTYLPDHRGSQWREGKPLPRDRFGILKRNGPGLSGPSAAR